MGKTISEIAEMKSVSNPLDTLFEIIAEDPEAKCRRGLLIRENELLAYLKHPKSMIGIDTFALFAIHHIIYLILTRIIYA